MVTGTFLTAWRWVDKIYYGITRLQYVDQSNQNLFRIVIKPYRGEPLKTRDGVWLKKGDWYAKLHLHNLRIAQLLRENTEHHSGIRDELLIIREIRKSFPALTEYLEHHPHGKSVHVLLGTTFLYHGSKRLGFDVQELPSAFRAWMKSLFLQCILLCCHPQGWRRLQQQKDKWIPKRVFISKEQLNQRYKMRGCDYG
ncbi:YkoP family protein [Melghirimyces algeriensis]|uniref:YkoP-like domain-containing protein n=1 Tax=Melghirimyces algeriensis TaxID=910412 RepID=A0A521BQQ7_9BACL|nr:hypothetical protein [Melghirimyces algeriensis]SMO49439.1 hypothetical protein SAMN06264849_102315 [Melghirimyces algeriensis]